MSVINKLFKMKILDNSAFSPGNRVMDDLTPAYTTAPMHHKRIQYKARFSEDFEHSGRQYADVISNSIIEMVSNKFNPDIVGLLAPIDVAALESSLLTEFDSTWSNQTNGTVIEDYMHLYRHSTWMAVIYTLAYLVVFLLGIVGNFFVIAVVFRSPRMRTVTNYFIVNLAVADVLVIVFCLPATLVSNVYVPWVMGGVMCKTVPYIQGVSVIASVYSLVAVSLDRFFSIWWPLKIQITKRRARFIIFVIWVVALSITVPWILYFEVVTFSEEPIIKLCIEVWPTERSETVYFVLANLIFCYLLPMIMITMCYILIWIRVSKRHIPSDTKDAQMERMQQKSKVKVVKMLVVVVILFVLSWLPLYMIFLRIKLGGQQFNPWEDSYLPILTPFAQWLGASNSCINPVLYAFFNTKYRRGFFAIIKSRKCCGRLRYYETVALMSSSTSMRKSSHYHNNNTSSSRRSPPANNAVAFIFNNTGV